MREIQFMSREEFLLQKRYYDDLEIGKNIYDLYIEGDIVMITPKGLNEIGLLTINKDRAYDNYKIVDINMNILRDKKTGEPK